MTINARHRKHYKAGNPRKDTDLDFAIYRHNKGMRLTKSELGLLRRFRIEQKEDDHLKAQIKYLEERQAARAKNLQRKQEEKSKPGILGRIKGVINRVGGLFKKGEGK